MAQGSAGELALPLTLLSWSGREEKKNMWGHWHRHVFTREKEGMWEAWRPCRETIHLTVWRKWGGGAEQRIYNPLYSTLLCWTLRCQWQRTELLPLWISDFLVIMNLKASDCFCCKLQHFVSCFSQYLGEVLTNTIWESPFGDWEFLHWPLHDFCLLSGNDLNLLLSLDSW